MTAYEAYSAAAGAAVVIFAALSGAAIAWAAITITRWLHAQIDHATNVINNAPHKEDQS